MRRGHGYPGPEIRVGAAAGPAPHEYTDPAWGGALIGWVKRNSGYKGGLLLHSVYHC